MKFHYSSLLLAKTTQSKLALSSQSSLETSTTMKLAHKATPDIVAEVIKRFKKVINGRENESDPARALTTIILEDVD